MACLTTTGGRTSLAYKSEALCQNPFVEDVSAMQLINILPSDGINIEVELADSEVIRSDRQTTAPIAVAKDTNAGFSTYLQVGELTDLLEGALFGVATPISAEFVTASAAVGSNMLVGSGFPVMSPGTRFTITSAVESQLNGVYAVALTPESSATAIYLDPATPIVSANADTLTINKFSRITNDVYPKAFTFVQGYEGISTYVVGNNLTVGEYTLNLSVGEIPQQTFTMAGTTLRSLSADPKTATVPASNTVELNPTDNFKKFWLSVDNVPQSNLLVTNVEITVNNNLTPFRALGSEFAADISEGSVGVTGTVTFALKNRTLLEAYRLGTKIQIGSILQDIAGNYFSLEIPYATITAHPNVIPARDEVVTVAATFQANVSPLTGKSVSLHYLA